MTVQTSTNVASFNGNGVTQIFPIAFKFNNDTDLIVMLADDATGFSSLLTLNSDYTVSGEGDEEGGLINVVVAPAVGKRLFVSRVVDILQMTDLRNQGKFFAEVHEDAFDLLTMIAQQHQSDIARSLRVAETDPEPARIPSAVQRAGKLLAFDAEGNPTTALPVADSSTELRQQLAEEDGAMLVFFRGAPLPKTLGRVLTPEQYGAVGDGAANDTAAWVAAAAALQPGDTLRASGEYLIHGSDVVVSGIDSFVLDLQGARFRQQTNNSKTLRIEACTKFSVKGGVFYGRGGAAGEFLPASTSYNGVAGIYLSHCDYVQIYGNRLFDHAGGSIVWRESDHLFIHDNLVEGIGSTYIAAGANGQDFAIGGFSDDIARMDFVANISNNEIRGTAFGIFHNRCKSLIISGNTIDGIPGQHGIYTIECSGMTVTGNTFRNVNNQACKMQLENYAGRGLATVGALNHTGIVFSGNTVDDCGDGFAVISTSLSDGTDQKVFGVEVVGNTINNVTQDGLILNHCVDAQIGPNNINDTGRFGISFRNSSGTLFGNTIKKSGASGISASQFDDIDYINNTLIDCGLNNLAGAGNDVPILIANTANPLPSQVATPKAFFRNNRIQFTSGDAASANLIFTSTRDSVHIEGTRTNSLKTVRVDGSLLFCDSNDFVGFASGAQNSPSTFLPGHGRREYHGQQNPQAAGSTAAFQRGDICWNTNVLATGAVFWVCTASGSPGTWAVGATR